MGRPKHLVPLPPAAGAQSLLHLLLARFASGFSEVLIAASPEAVPPELQALTRPDRYPGLGPLAGIEAALSACSADVVLVLACDLPLAELTTARHLVRLSRSHDAAWARSDGRAQPLFGAYRRSALPKVRAALEERRLQATALAATMDVGYLEVSAEELTNLNTPQELDAYRERLQGDGSWAPPSAG